MCGLGCLLRLLRLGGVRTSGLRLVRALRPRACGLRFSGSLEFRVLPFTGLFSGPGFSMVGSSLEGF